MAYIMNKLNLLDKEDKVYSHDAMTNQLSFGQFDLAAFSLIQPTFDKLKNLCINTHSSQLAVSGDNIHKFAKDTNKCDERNEGFLIKAYELRNLAEREFNHCVFSSEYDSLYAKDVMRQCKAKALKEYFRGLLNVERDVIVNFTSQLL